MFKRNIIKLHIITDLNLPLSEEFNQTIEVDINTLLKALDDLVDMSSVIISKLDSKMLIANKGSLMIALTLKENDTNWSEILSYRLRSYIYRK